MSVFQSAFHPEQIAVKIPIWREILLLRELTKLRSDPVFRGMGIPHGDGSAVITIPGFLCSDNYTAYLTKWLNQIGYRAFPSGIEQNNDCIERALQRILTTIEIASAETGGKVHLIGHSLGGVLARIAATNHPEKIASIITLGSPFRGIRAHSLILRLSDKARRQIQSDQPHCFTGFCECPSVAALRNTLPPEVRHCAIYTKTDGIVDWNSCLGEEMNHEVKGTHGGLVFNAEAYRLMAEWLKN